MYKRIILPLIIFIFILFTGQKVSAYTQCSALTCHGGDMNNQNVTSWCQFIGAPYNSSYDCNPNPPYGYQTCYWDPAACDSADCRDYIQMDPNYCVGKVSCPDGVPNECVNPECNFNTGQCYSACAIGPWCVAPTSTPIPTPTPTSNPSCVSTYGPGNYMDCGICHGYVGQTGGSCDDRGAVNGYGCCIGTAPVTPPPSAATITPTPTPANQVCSGGISCNAKIYNTNNPTLQKNTIFKNTRGVGNPFSANNSITIQPGETVELSGNLAYSCPFVRDQYIVRRSDGTAINDCIEAWSDGMLSNFCQNMVGKIAFSRTGNFPYGDGSIGPDGLVPDLIGPITYNEPLFNSFPAYNDTKTYSGTCRTTPIKCCSRGTNPDGTYRCQTDPNDNSCDDYITPSACLINDDGMVKTMDQHARDHTVRKQFNTPGTYIFEAYADRQMGNGNNFSNPCQVEVVVKTPTPPPVTTVTLTGRLINDNNADAFYDPSATQGDSIYPANTPGTSVTITSSTGSTAGITYTVNADGTYSFANVPIGATYTISVSGIPASRFFVNNISGGGVLVSSSAPPNIPDIYISRYYTISGIVFNDANKNKIYNPGLLATDDKPYLAGVVTIQQTGQQANVNTATGTYTFDLGYQLRPNIAYTISYTNSAIAPPYIIWLPSYSGIVVGPTCPNLATQAPNATCATVTATFPADITNLNFAVTNSVAWVQYQGLDVRNETFLNHQTPTTVANVCKDANTGTTNGYGSVGKY